MYKCSDEWIKLNDDDIHDMRAKSIDLCSLKLRLIESSN